MGGWLAGITDWLWNPANRAVLGWLGAGVGAILVGGWKVFTYFDARRNEPPPAPPHTPPYNQSITPAGGITTTSAVYMGLDEEKAVQLLLKELEARGLLVKAHAAGLDRDTIIKLAQRLKPDEILDFDQAVRELENAVTIALDAIARGGRGSNEGEFIDKVLARVADLTRQAQFDEGAAAVDSALAELEQRDKEQREAYLRHRITLLEAGIEQDILRRDTPAVARRIEALAATQSHERPTWSQTFIDYQRRFYEEGDQKGLNFPLEVAIFLAQRMLDTAPNATLRGYSANQLGVALGVLGERRPNTELLELAVMVLTESLKDRVQEHFPLDWATTQNNLGIVFRALGDRESGAGHLQKAVVAFGQALKERTRERVPLDWAATQNNLGTVLQTLGDRESGTERLEQAVTAYQESLKERTRERVPLDWAVTQNNLGNVLLLLETRENSAKRLEIAVATFKETLKVRTRERVPFQWASTQNNIGNAFSILGERKNKTELLEKAVAAYKEALKEWTRERVPLDWAMVHTNLGTVLLKIGEREQGTERLEQAVVAYKAALEEFTRDNIPLNWAVTQCDLGLALNALGERESGTESLQQAVTAFGQALTVFTPETSPHYHDMAQRNLARAQALLDARRKGGRGRG